MKPAARTDTNRKAESSNSLNSAFSFIYHFSPDGWQFA